MNRVLRAGLFVTLGSFVAGSAESAPNASQRYPYDPACPWGRLADGHGMLVRCLTAEDAQRLTAPNSNPDPALATPALTPAISNTPVATGAASSSPPTASAESNPSEALIAELVGVTVEEGSLPLAQKKLSLPLDKYQDCVTTHGGLKGATGQVTVKFLVRERGRAEGASAEKFQGMSEKAAKCIADVIDRRPTGTPDAPIVEASAVIRVRRKLER